MNTKKIIEERGTLNTVNTALILSKLIQEAGRWCEQYASDLFLQWKYEIDDPLRNNKLQTKTVIFGFRQKGVDGNDYYEIRKNQVSGDYYRAVWFLHIHVKNDVVSMRLQKQETN